MGSLLKEQKGFTFIEIVCVLVLIGILGAVVATRTVDFDAGAIGGRQQIRNYIRFAQLMAMKSNTVCGVAFDGSAYWLFQDGDISDKISFPQNDGEDIAIDSALGTVTETIYFDLWGRPYSDASLTTPRSTGAIGGVGLTMYADTGYVQ